MAQHKLETIDLLKIDVEGHELDVLKGATLLALHGNRIGFVQFEFWRLRPRYQNDASGLLLFLPVVWIPNRANSAYRQG